MELEVDLGISRKGMEVNTIKIYCIHALSNKRILYICFYMNITKARVNSEN